MSERPLQRICQAPDLSCRLGRVADPIAKFLAEWQTLRLAIPEASSYYCEPVSIEMKFASLVAVSTCTWPPYIWDNTSEAASAMLHLAVLITGNP